MEIKGFFSSKMGGRLFLVFFSVMLIAFAGCGKEKKEAVEKAPEEAAKAESMPEGHPPVDKAAEQMTQASHAAIKTQKEIRISDEVRKKWTEIKVELTDKAAKRSEVVTLKVGSTVMLTKDGFNLRIEVFVPDYAIVENRIESRSNEPKNPALLVDLLQNDKSVARGWVFKEFPEFNSFSNQRFHLVLL